MYNEFTTAACLQLNRAHLGQAWGKFTRICKILANHFDMDVAGLNGFNGEVQGLEATCNEEWTELLIKWDAGRRHRARSNGIKTVNDVHCRILRSDLGSKDKLDGELRALFSRQLLNAVFQTGLRQACEFSVPLSNHSYFTLELVSALCMTATFAGEEHVQPRFVPNETELQMQAWALATLWSLCRTRTGMHRVAVCSCGPANIFVAAQSAAFVYCNLEEQGKGKGSSNKTRWHGEWYKGCTKKIAGCLEIHV
jgi:hypothetical protein